MAPSTHNKLFFNAAGNFTKLKELHMPQWDAFVGRDEKTWAECLIQVPDLEAVVILCPMKSWEQSR